MNNDHHCDIIDYTYSDEDTSSFVRIDHRRWNNLAYWKDSEIESCVSSEARIWTERSSNSNKYEALCCWCVNDDESDENSQSYDEDISQVEGNDNVSRSDESSDTDIDANIHRRIRRARRNSDASELRSIDEIEKAEEADNILSYEEQVQLEMEELAVYKVFYRPNSEVDEHDDAAQVIDMPTLNRIMEMDNNLRETLQVGDINEAFHQATIPETTGITTHSNSIIEMNIYQAEDTSA